MALGFRSDSPEWYDQLYRGLRMNAIVECIKRGGKVTKKAVGVSKKAMRECLLFLLLHHNESLGYQERAIMFILHHDVGRGGEVDSSVWKSAYWADDRAMLVFELGSQRMMASLRRSWIFGVS